MENSLKQEALETKSMRGMINLTSFSAVAGEGAMAEAIARVISGNLKEKGGRKIRENNWQVRYYMQKKG